MKIRKNLSIIVFIWLNVFVFAVDGVASSNKTTMGAAYPAEGQGFLLGKRTYQAGRVDEAIRLGRTKEDYLAHRFDNFAGMDGRYNSERVWQAPDLSADEVQGRNTWLMWGAGNQGFWNYLAHTSNGIVDLLRLLDNRHIPRNQRLSRMGLINEPGFQTPKAANQYGLLLDEAKNIDAQAISINQKDAWRAKYGTYEPYPKGYDYTQKWLPNPDIYGYSSLDKYSARTLKKITFSGIW